MKPSVAKKEKAEMPRPMRMRKRRLPPKNLLCGESWTVRIDSRENWYLNSTKTSQNELTGVLSQRLRDKMNCAVYLDVDPSLPYAVAIEAVATIQKTRAKAVVLLTPKTKRASVY